MKILKRLFVLMMSVVLVAGNVTAFADTEEYIELLPKIGYQTSNSSQTGSWGGNTLHFAYSVITWTVNAEESGPYLIRMNFGSYMGYPVTFGISVNGTKVGNYVFDPPDASSGYSTSAEYDSAIVMLREGENVFSIDNTSPGYDVNMSWIRFIKQDDSVLQGERESLSIGDEAYVENGVYPRGTDTITVGYTMPLLGGSFGDIELTDGVNDIGFEPVATGENLVLALTESLDYNAQYTLTLKGVQDMYTNEMTEETFVFRTSDENEDVGIGSVDIEEFDIVSDDASASGTVRGSHGKGIAGRKVELWITVPNSAPVLAAEGVSLADGKYILECNLSDYDIVGDVIGGVKAAYAGASATATKEDYMSAANRIKFTADAYTETTLSESTIKGTGNVYYGGMGITLTYEFNAVREGGFMFSLEQASYKGLTTNLTFELDGKVIHSYDFTPRSTDGNLGPKDTYDICGVWLTKGNHTLKITNNGQTHRMWNIIFTKVPAARCESIKIGTDEYNENDIYERGTDSITLDFDSAMDADNTGSVILEDADGAKIGAVTKLDESDSSKVVIALSDTLDYGKTYTLTASGIKDSCGYTMEDVELVFATTEENVSDKGFAETVIDSFDIKNGVATVTGAVKGSTGVGISGRKVEFYLTLPEGDESLAVQGVTGKDGVFSLSYTLENDDAAGDCTAGILAEYADKKVTKTYYYVSANRLLPILDALSKTTQGSGDTEACVEYVLRQNKKNLGIDPDADLAEITASKVYDMLIGAEVDTIADFHDLYKSSVLLQKINEASDSDDIEELFGNSENITLLGLDAKKLEALNTTGTEELCGVIADFEDVSDKESFAKLFDAAFNKALAVQAGLGDITPKTSSASAEKGAEIKLDINSEAEYGKVKKLILDFSFEGALKNEVNDISFNTQIGTSGVSVSGDKAVVTIEVSNPDEAKRALGVLSFSASEVGSGTVRMSGVAIASTGTDYDAELAVNEQVYSVTVEKQKEEKIGGGFASGRSPSVSAGTVMTPVTAPQDVQVVAKTFTDLSEAPWAEEAVLGLYNRQAINMTEEKLFYPNREITRAEFIKMVVLANDMYMGSLTEVNFADVKEGDWYYQYVRAAINFNLITGDGNGNFRPNDLITREDICVILSRVKGAGTASVSQLFADDGQISDYARNAVYTMKESGIVNGIGDNVFAPKANATRAMAAKIIYGLVK